MKNIIHLKWLRIVIGIVAVGGLLFQVAHFYEHFAQIIMWFIRPDKSQLYMSSWAMDLKMSLGSWAQSFSPNTSPHMLGMELLHFFGNIIFLAGIFAYRFFNKSPALRIAWWVQSLHALEHTLLTFTTFILGQPLGFTTLFGLNMTPTVAASFRAWIHFILNFIPSMYVIKALFDHYKNIAATNEALNNSNDNSVFSDNQEKN